MRPIISTAILGLLLLTSSAAVSADPWADQVVSFVIGNPAQFANDPRFNQPSRALGRPYGLVETAPDNSSQVSLGDLVWSGLPGSTVTGGYITLKFNEPVYDDPKNPYGLDFIVYGNASFKIGSGSANPHSRWQEPGFVEISQDGIIWYLIKPNILPHDLNKTGQNTGQSNTTLRNYAEYTPTIGLPQDLYEAGMYPDFLSPRTPEEYYTVPDRQSVDGQESTFLVDRVSGGGDAMDIADAVLQVRQGVPFINNYGTVPAGITWFQYIRITDAYRGDSDGSLLEISTEIDAVSDVRPAVTIGEAKRLNQGDYAVITDAQITWSTCTSRYDTDSDLWLYTGKCFAQSSNRVSGIELNYTDASMPLTVGDKATVTGHVSKTGVRCALRDVIFTVTSNGNQQPAPIGTNLKSLCADMAYGLRVRGWGKVTTARMQEGDHYYCVISDGGSTAKVVWADPTYLGPALGKHISVTGICDREEGSGATIIRLIDTNSDIIIYD